MTAPLGVRGPLREFDPPLADRLAARPWDERRELPIPVVNIHTDGRGVPFVDFLGVDPQQARRVAEQGRCGLCDGKLDGDIAFLGTAAMPVQRLCSDPPMHEQCARDALRLCPHLRLRHHKPAPAHRLHDEARVQLDPDTVRSRPDSWVLATTDRYRLSLMQGVLVFTVGPFLSLRHFAYTGPDESLVEGDWPVPGHLH